jgi:flagellar protein FlbD
VIQITRLDHTPLVINCDLIEMVEATPDTLLSLTTGRKVLVKESVAEVVARVVAHKQRVLGHPAALKAEGDPPRHPAPGAA